MSKRDEIRRRALEEYYSAAELAALRKEMREESKKANAEARKQGVKLHPRIAARRKAQ